MIRWRLVKLEVARGGWLTGSNIPLLAWRHPGVDMIEMTARALIQSVLASNPSAGDAEMVRRVEALTTVVLDLLAEVEALRQAQAAKGSYRDAYRAACLLTHNSAGPSSGWEKLIECYYPRDKSADGRVWRGQ